MYVRTTSSRMEKEDKEKIQRKNHLLDHIHIMACLTGLISHINHLHDITTPC